ncbi:hypothetical protein AVEN_270299-1 [Araneus ventricosus]|uniref:Uncharacterized protein n=1 Tax=Araneus ventricosus TaxID=182803 RepID=A0A4Y1ZS21_ARAVE|nr:hypothetical protein AVEN_270299-1 [Araneus ventricosus]
MIPETPRQQLFRLRQVSQRYHDWLCHTAISGLSLSLVKIFSGISSKPDSSKDPPYMGPIASSIMLNGETSSCWFGAEVRIGVPAQVSSSTSDRGSKSLDSSPNSFRVL